MLSHLAADFSFRAQKRGTMETSNEKCRLLVHGDGAKAFVERSAHTIEDLLFFRFYGANISQETNACPCLGRMEFFAHKPINYTYICPFVTVQFECHFTV